MTENAFTRGIRGLLLGHHGCTCDTSAMVAAQMKGEPVPLCAIHHKDEIAAQKKQAQLEEIARRDITNERIAERIREMTHPTPAPPPPDPPIAQVIANQLGGGNHMALNSPELAQSVADIFGGTVHEGPTL